LNLPPPKQGFVLFVGQRAGYKNFSLALRALDHLPELELLCVGGSPIARDELDAAPEEVRRRVRYMGFVSDTELNHLYNQAVCLLYLSSYEGFGIPVIEAMRAGCPVVSTCCKAVLEVGRHALTVVPGDDPRSVAHAVSMLASGDARAARVRAGLSVASEFSWERTYQATHRIYRALAQL
jgi:mannosyltransferase